MNTKTILTNNYVKKAIDASIKLNSLEQNSEKIEEIKQQAQMFKLTKDNGEINYITTDNLDIYELEPGNYSCVASRFINAPIPGDGGYVDINVRQNTNASGTRKTYVVFYNYEERVFVGQKHLSYDYIVWKEVEFKSSGYNYSQPFYDNEVETLYKKLLPIQNENTKSIGFITDIHYIRGQKGTYGANALRHMDQIIAFGNGMLDAIVFGGDSINGKGARELITELMDVNHHALQSNIPLFVCKGNHDYGSWRAQNATDKSYDKNIINNYQWNKLITSKYVKKYNFVGDKLNKEHGYAYYDFEDVKLRIIMLDACDHNKKDITDANGNVNIDTSTFCIGQKQLTWLTDQALSLPDKEGWNVLIFSHYAPYRFSDINVASSMRNGYLLQNVLKSFINKTTYSATNNTSYGASVSCDFTKTNHKVVGLIYGHYHADVTTFKDYNYITCMCSAPSSETPNYREIGTESEDSWTVFTVNTALNQIHINRFGQGKDFEQIISY